MKMQTRLLMMATFVALAMSGSIAQDNSAGLEGRQFKCRISEITPPDVDRMPMVYDEVITFEAGRLVSDFMKRFISEDVPYSASIDDRRAVAFTVVAFEAQGNGTKGDSSVSITYTGNIAGYVGLYGEILINGNGFQEKYIVETLNP